jgi:hypothetical protein
MGQFCSPSRQSAKEIKSKRQKEKKKVGTADGPAGLAGRDASRPARHALDAAHLGQAASAGLTGPAPGQAASALLSDSLAKLEGS